MSTVTLHILLALSAGAKHGYAIMQHADRASGGRVRLGPGTLYGAIKRLLLDGLIEEVGGLLDDRRRVYRLTGAGARALADETDHLASVVRAARGSAVLRRLRPGTAQA